MYIAARGRQDGFLTQFFFLHPTCPSIFTGGEIFEEESLETSNICGHGHLDEVRISLEIANYFLVCVVYVYEYAAVAGR